MSVAGFLIYYIHYLRPPQRPSVATSGIPTAPTFLFAGYSYGAMVTMQLPPLTAFLGHFASPVTHTAFADIRLRAQHLAEQQTVVLDTPSSPRKSLGMRVGGDEDTSPRKAHDKLRMHSPDREERIRKGVKDLLSRSKLIHRKQDHHHAVESGGSGHEGHEMHREPCLEKLDNLTRFCSAYLLVSPPVGIVTHLATMSFSNPLSNWSRRIRGGGTGTMKDQRGDQQGDMEQEDEAETKLMLHPTLVIYGDQDGFLTPRKMRDWTVQLSSTDGSQFRYVVIPGAGHFWAEDNVGYKLKEAVSSFAAKLIRPRDLQKTQS